MEAQPKCRSFKNISRNGLTSFNLLIYRDSVTLSAAAKRAPRKVVPERHFTDTIVWSCVFGGKSTRVKDQE